MAKRTLKEDRELIITLATKLGHEMGSWDWWFGKRRAIIFCKLCGNWAGLNSGRNWTYESESEFGWVDMDAGITGPAIIDDNFHWRKERCSGVRWRGIERAKWTREYNRILSLIANNKPDEAAKILLGAKP